MAAAGGDRAGAARADARAHAFVSDLDAPVLSPDDHHHLARVMRLRAGVPVTVGDGRGRWRTAVMTGDARVEPTGEVVADPAPAPELAVAFALVKGARPEMVVQKLTEVGTDRIVPFVADRSVVRWDAAKADRNAARLTEVARQAAMQCRRSWLPLVEPVAEFADVAARPGAALADIDGGPPTLDHPIVLVGPEGGWSSEERGATVARVCIASHVLRAETAAITVGGLLAALRGGLVRDAS